MNILRVTPDKRTMGMQHVVAWMTMFACSICGLTGVTDESLMISLPAGSTGLQLSGSDARLQLVVSAGVDDELRDATGEVEFQLEPSIASIDALGFVKPLSNGQATLTAKLGRVADAGRP